MCPNAHIPLVPARRAGLTVPLLVYFDFHVLGADAITMSFVNGVFLRYRRPLLLILDDYLFSNLFRPCIAEPRIKPDAMSDSTIILKSTIKVVGLALWVAIIYHYGIIELIGEIISAVYNHQITIVCYK